jgi:hypothetical protein
VLFVQGLHAPSSTNYAYKWRSVLGTNLQARQRAAMQAGADGVGKLVRVEDLSQEDLNFLLAAGHKNLLGNRSIPIRLGYAALKVGMGPDHYWPERSEAEVSLPPFCPGTVGPENTGATL